MTLKQRYEAHLNSPTWLGQKAEAFLHWGRFCSCCGSANDIQVHHLTYRNLIDCTADDLMPLCKPCHDAVHALPELDSMVHRPGNNMHKRRMVILRLKSPNAVTFEPLLTPSGRMVKSKLTHSLLHRERKELSSNPSAPAPAIIHQLSKRFGVSESTWSDWPHQTILCLFNRTAFPIFARPQGIAQIATTAPEDTILLTSETLQALRTAKNGVTRFTVEALGMNWNSLQKGWFNTFTGKTIPKRQYLRALAGRSITRDSAQAIAFPD
jgi:hypothetical protein